ncbi:MAG: hypothetical protein ABI440_06995 [Casimicrobiaceae bacterium]
MALSEDALLASMPSGIHRIRPCTGAFRHGLDPPRFAGCGTLIALHPG